MSSASSATSNSMSFNKVIKDFKKSLTEKKTPKNLFYLNRIMILVFSITIILSSVDFAELSISIEDLEANSYRSIMTERRSMSEIQLTTNVRSLLNIANGYEFDRYDGLS
jgi:hypothetical protein